MTDPTIALKQYLINIGMQEYEIFFEKALSCSAKW